MSAEDGCAHSVGMRSSTGSTIEEVLRLVKGWEVIPGLNIVSSLPDVVAVKNKIKWKGDGCKYEYKESAKGFQEKYKCK